MSKILIIVLICCLPCFAIAEGRESDSAVMYDRFGVQYPLNNVQVSRLASAEPHCSAGKFTVFFIENETPIFSDTTVQAAQYRRVVCAVLEDLSRLFSSTIGEGSVNIKVEGYNDPNDGALAKASAYYAFYRSKDTNPGLLWEYISGRTPTSESASRRADFMAGYIKVNFVHIYNVDIDATDFQAADLYSVILHEMMHALGIASGLDAQGKSIFGLERYTTYDALLQHHQEGKLIQEVDCYDVQVRATSGNVTGRCEPGSIPLGVQGASGTIYPVYAPTPFKAGSSISHLDQECMSEQIVVAPGFAYGKVYRTPSQAEVDILCALGYSISGEYGYPRSPSRYRRYTIQCSAGPVGISDRVQHFVTTDSNGVPHSRISFPASRFLDNDILTDSLSCIEYIAPEYGTYKLKTYTLPNIGREGSITFDRFHSSPFLFSVKDQLRYRPKDKHGRIGKPTYITIDPIVPPLPPCPASCQLLCNGEFEVSAFPNTQINNNGLLGCEVETYLQGWMAKSSPDMLRQSYDTNFFRHMAASIYPAVFPLHRHTPHAYNRDINNTKYMFLGAPPGRMEHVGHEGVFQRLSHALRTDKEYVLEAWACVYTGDEQDFKHVSFYDSGYVRVFLDRSTPCIGSRYSPTSESMPLEVRSVAGAEWKRLVWGPFRPAQAGLQWVSLAASVTPTPQEQYARSVFLDGVILREANVSVQMRLSNQFPCAGETVIYTINICKDKPNSASMPIRIISDPRLVIEKLPEGATKVGNEIQVVLEDRLFDSSRCTTISFLARVPPTLVGNNIALETQVEAGGVYVTDCLASSGVYKMTLYPRPKNIEVSIERDARAVDTVLYRAILRRKGNVANSAPIGVLLKSVEGGTPYPFYCRINGELQIDTTTAFFSSFIPRHSFSENSLQLYGLRFGNREDIVIEWKVLGDTADAGMWSIEILTPEGNNCRQIEDIYTGGPRRIGESDNTLTIRALPNPVTTMTQIEVVHPYNDRLIVKIYDALGREVQSLIDGIYPNGTYRVSWIPANDLSTGMYYAMLVSRNKTESLPILYKRE